MNCKAWILVYHITSNRRLDFLHFTSAHTKPCNNCVGFSHYAKHNLRFVAFQLDHRRVPTALRCLGHCLYQTYCPRFSWTFVLHNWCNGLRRQCSRHGEQRHAGGMFWVEFDSFSLRMVSLRACPLEGSLPVCIKNWEIMGMRKDANWMEDVIRTMATLKLPYSCARPFPLSVEPMSHHRFVPRGWLSSLA